jgi:hypothetical protein
MFHINNYIITVINQKDLNRIWGDLNKLVKADNREKLQVLLGLKYEIKNGKILLIKRFLIEQASKIYNIKYGVYIPMTKFLNSNILLRWNTDSDLGFHLEALVLDQTKY